MDIVEPKITFSLKDENLSLIYKEDAFNITEFDVVLSMTSQFKEPYNTLDLTGTEAENVTIDVSEYTITLPADSLQFASISNILEVKETISLKPNETKELEHKVYVNDNYIPEKTSELLEMTVDLITNETPLQYKTSISVTKVEDELETTTSAYIIGTLEKVNTNKSIITIDGKKYTADSSSVEKATTIPTKEKVIALLQDSKIIQIDKLSDIAEPKITFSFKEDNPSLIYENGTFNKTEVDVMLSINAQFKVPYNTLDLLGTAAEDITIDLSSYIIKVPTDILQFTSNLDLLEVKETISIKLNEVKNYEHTVYVKADYIPQEISQFATIQATVNEKEEFSLNLPIANRKSR